MTEELEAYDLAKSIESADAEARALLTAGECNLASCYLRAVNALREIAHGTSGLGARTDVATMQSTARLALGEIHLG